LNLWLVTLGYKPCGLDRIPLIDAKDEPEG
jgi:hypothetical protein